MSSTEMIPPVDNSTLPPRIKEWLNARGITDAVLTAHRIGWDGKRIIIPIPAAGGGSFNKYRRDPASEEGPKYTYDQGAHTEIFHSVNAEPGVDTRKLIICEGELDVLALASKGFQASSSTGGAGTFKKEWVPYLEGYDLYVLFDNDKAGREGAIKVCRLLPKAKYVPLPPEVGDHGDITDYFTKLGKTAADLDILLQVSEPLPPEPPAPKARKRGYKGDGTDLQKAKAFPLKELLLPHRITTAGFVRCPIHQEKSASMKVYKDNRWYCYGCGKGGDTVDFMMLRDQLSMPDAIKKILATKV